MWQELNKIANIINSAKSRQGAVLELGGWAGGLTTPCR